MKFNVKIIFVILVVILNNQLAFTQNTSSEKSILKDWQLVSIQEFKGKDLYGHINGGAELFHEFGFDKLVVQHYQNDGAEITVETYNMESPTAALGIYLIKCGKETPQKKVNARNTGNRFQLTMVKDSCFIQINNFSGDPNLKIAITVLANQLLDRIQKNRLVSLLNILPQENLTSGSEMIIRGPFALDPIYTFGEGDILQLKGEIFGVVSDYQIEDEQFTRIIIPYPSGRYARQVFENLLENLDPYLEILSRNEEQFIFSDYQNKYGLVEIENSVINIKIHLSEKSGLN